VPNDTRASQSRPCIVLISPHSSYRLGPYIKAAEKLNTHVIVASQGEYSLVSAAASGIHINFNQSDAPEQILTALQGKNINAVIGTDDLTVEIASRVALALGLRHNDLVASRYTQRKDLARECLANSPVRIPAFEKHALTALIGNPSIGIAYPCVIKPLALSGSRGVIRINNTQGLLAACVRLQAMLMHATMNDEERQYVLVEAYIPGYEYAFEGLLDNGHLQMLALFDKPDLMEGPYFEETYYITPSRLDQQSQNKIILAVEQACKAYGLHEGPVHAEVKIHDDQVWFMEMASRTIGGQCAQLLTYATGLSLEEIVIQQAAGFEVHINEAQNAAGVLMIPIKERGLLRRVEGILAASKIEYIEDIEISIQEGYELIPLPEGDSYLGFIFARAPTPELADQALRKAYNALTIITSPLLHIAEV
jgi:biotin carboxylase